MKHLKYAIRHLEKIRKIERHKHHPLLHHIHKHHQISRRTLFYVKEYGQHSNVVKTILRESLKILILASLLSSFGGLALENVKYLFVSIIPLVILLPALNDMIGDYGTIVSARFSAMLYSEKKKEDWHKNKELHKLFTQIMIIALRASIFNCIFALGISTFSDFHVDAKIATKIFFITIIDVVILVSIIFLVAISAGIYFYKKGEDPNNFLIPITTSIADFGNMIILAILVSLLF
jgi:cation transporter-like permease